MVTTPRKAPMTGWSHRCSCYTLQHCCLSGTLLSKLRRVVISSMEHQLVFLPVPTFSQLPSSCWSHGVLPHRTCINGPSPSPPFLQILICVFSTTIPTRRRWVFLTALTDIPSSCFLLRDSHVYFLIISCSLFSATTAYGCSNLLPKYLIKARRGAKKNTTLQVFFLLFSIPTTWWSKAIDGMLYNHPTTSLNNVATLAPRFYRFQVTSFFVCEFPLLVSLTTLPPDRRRDRQILS